MTRRDRAAALATMCVGMFLVLLDVTVVNVALPAIAEDTGASIAGLQGVVDAYTVPFAALLLVSGSLADRYGAPRLVQVGLVLIGLASAACALSPTTSALVVTRTAQGVGAAVVLPASMSVILRLYPGRAEQARALGIWAGVSSLALPAGPLLGGLLTEVLGWRSIFWVNLPVAAAALLAVRAVVPEQPAGRSGPVDVAGGFCATGTLGGVVMAVIALGHGAPLPAVVVALLVAVLAGALLVLLESRAPAPMLPAHVLTRRRTLAATGVAGLMNFVGIGTILVMTLFLQDVQGRSPVEGGLAMVPFFAPLALLAPLAGRLVARVGARPPMAAGLALGILGSGSLLLVDRDTSLAGLLPAQLGLGVGMGFLTTAVVTAAVQSVPAELAGLASGTNNAARQTGGALGVAAYGALAGAPSDPGFVHGLHVTGIVGAVAWSAALGLTPLTAERRPVAEPARTGASLRD